MLYTIANTAAIICLIVFIILIIVTALNQKRSLNSRLDEMSDESLFQLTKSDLRERAFNELRWLANYAYYNKNKADFPNEKRRWSELYDKVSCVLTELEHVFYHKS